MPSRRRLTRFAARSGTTWAPRSDRRIGSLSPVAGGWYPCGRPSPTVRVLGVIVALRSGERGAARAAELVRPGDHRPPCGRGLLRLHAGHDSLRAERDRRDRGLRARLAADAPRRRSARLLAGLRPGGPRAAHLRAALLRLRAGRLLRHSGALPPHPAADHPPTR